MCALVLFLYLISFIINNLFAWNCLGAGTDRFLRIFNCFMQDNKPDIVFLFETRISGKCVDHAIQRMGFDFSHRIEAQGFSDGLWILWRHYVSVDIILNHGQFIHLAIDDLPERGKVFI